MAQNRPGRVALVAGSSRGIGKAIATALLESGFRVNISGRDANSLSATLAELRAAYGRHNVHGVVGDLTKASATRNFLDKSYKRWGRLDVVVGNVGSGAGSPGPRPGVRGWRRMFRQNFWASVQLAEMSLPLIAQSRLPRIVFVASVTGVEATAAPLPYSAAKAALINYSKNLSRLVASEGITVNCVAPGNILFHGGSWERHLERRRDEVLDYIRQEVPVGRFGTPEDVAGLVVYLCSERANFITGACFVVDGGQTRTV